VLSLASDDVHSRSSLEPLTGHGSRFWGRVVPVLPRAGIPGLHLAGIASRAGGSRSHWPGPPPVSGVEGGGAPYAGRDQGSRPGGSRVRPGGPNATVEVIRP